MEKKKERRRRGEGGKEKEPLKILAFTKDCNITAALTTTYYDILWYTTVILTLA